MKFVYRELIIKSTIYRIYEVANVPKQFRSLYTPNDNSCILANAEGYRFLCNLLVVVANIKIDNSIFLVFDESKECEQFHEYYLGAEFHKNIMISNYRYSHISKKQLSQLLDMRKYTKGRLVKLEIPKYNFDKLYHWNFKNKLTVRNYSKWIMLSSDFDGYLYMAREANSFTDIEDDPEEYFAHAHLSFLTNQEDKLDLRYFYQG
ncbi:hypothetical protein [Vallitalea sp.]|jgi:hypothetical protein|uniref:hypothetical protein n=1 Tax=Vallitalea sp. TaxID=1882829 RepID=UPI0025F49D2A|nr:hypothetical protein [Vallitalea sp.]MCT4687118.1 hypothetical protein [Vallitalea sp.]